MIRAGLLAVALGCGSMVGAVAQSPVAASGLPKAAGTVKATADGGFTLSAATGDVVVTVPAAAKVLVVPPGSKDLKSATPGSLTDVASGDKVLVTGTAGDAATALTATRVVLMKAGAIAASHAADEQAWQQGGGGIVKSVDPAGSVVLSSGGRIVTVNTTAKTIVRRYAPGSVKFDDAVVSTLASVKPGDQLRVRGQKSADGATVTADEIVVGTFANYSGLLTGIDATAGTVTLKDLRTKKTVTVAVTPSSDVHRLPAEAAARLAARMKGGAVPAGGGRPAGAPGAGGTGASGPGGAGRAGSDLSSMLSRLPTETLGGLKPGEAVMMVATEPVTASGQATAVTMVVGVEALITGSAGETMTLSPWSLGGGGDAAGGGGR
jgi:hypothetical protein